MKSKQKVEKILPLREKIATAKDVIELDFYHQVAKRMDGASSGTVRKWLKSINLKREQFGLPTIAQL